MERFLVWRGLDEWRAEASHVRIEDDRLTATGTQLGVTPEAYRLDYSLRTGPDFVTERLELSALVGRALKRLLLTRRHDGTWTADDRPLPELDGALDDDGAVLLSHEIAREIEQELEYPGQIKVTVIRESRATDYAR